MFYPVFLDLRNRRVLVVGGGNIAERKVDSLLEAGASVVVVSPNVAPALNDLAARRRIEVFTRTFADTDLDGVDLAISATDDVEAQRNIAAAARSRNVWINTVDQPELCDFIVPAVLRRGEVTIAISTSGTSPALAAALRKKLEGVVTEDVARVARILGAVRSEVHDRFPSPGTRKQIFEEIINSGILDWIRGCDDTAALERVRAMISKPL